MSGNLWNKPHFLAFLFLKPRNGSWTGLSVHFSGFLARRDDEATFTLIGGATQSRESEKCAIKPVALSPKR
ncbi:MAG: hypothetical protein V4447_13835 [Pseudomonadota bacterium]